MHCCDAQDLFSRIFVWCWLEGQRGVGVRRVEGRRTGAGVADGGFGVEHGAWGVGGEEPGTPVFAREAGRVGYKGLHVGPFSGGAVEADLPLSNDIITQVMGSVKF